MTSSSFHVKYKYFYIIDIFKTIKQIVKAEIKNTVNQKKKVLL